MPQTGDLERRRTSPPNARWRPARGGALRDWTPIVLAVSTLSLCLVAVAWVVVRVHERDDAGAFGPGPALAERAAPVEVPLWVSHRPDGVTWVLAGVWSDEGSDRAHDQELRERLGLEAASPLAWYSLLLFNLSDAERSVDLRDGALELEDATGPVKLVRLAGRLGNGPAALTPALEAVLGGLGALSDRVVLPPGDGTRVLVCFDRRVDLGRASAVRTGDGVAFAGRRMPRREFQRLLAHPEHDQVSTL